MIKAIVIDAGDIASALQAATPEAIKAVLSDVMTSARDQWIKIAGPQLNSMRRDYLAGIQNVVTSGMVASVSLVGVMANAVEHGMSAFDMHQTLLGPSVPVVPWKSGLKGKHKLANGTGYWRVIPFRHQTPGSIGQGGGVPMGSAYEGVVDNAAALGKAIYKAARKLGASTQSWQSAPFKPGWGKTTWGGRLPAGMAPKLKPIHSTDIYAGMVKVEKTYEAATQNTYQTFRVISDAVDAKWHHPGITARHFADDVEKYIQKVAPLAFAALVTGEKD